MGYIFSDLVVETIIRDGLTSLITNSSTQVPIVLEQLKSAYLNPEYGQAELNRFIAYITDNKIDIVQSWRQVEERVPCIYIQSVSTVEQEQKAFMGDYSGNTDTIAGGVITDRRPMRTVPIQESIQVGIHVSDPGGTTVLRWLYGCLVYFIVSRKNEMSKRGLDLATWNASDFNRLNEFLPENIYSRYLTLTFITYMEFPDLDSENVIYDIDISGGPGASEPGALLGGVKTESIKDPEYENNTYFTIDPT